MPDDIQLLDRFLATADHSAFRILVDRHLPMVYNLARRYLRGNPAHADDIAQSVFILLVQKARQNKISQHKPLAAWLYQTTRYCCANLQRIEARRIRREFEVAMHPSTITLAPASDLEQAELLSDALAQLSARERDLLLLRYSPAEPPIPQIAAALNISPAAAEKRIARALEKLRIYFARTEPEANVASLLAMQSAAIPIHLSNIVTSAATSAATASPLALALVASFAKTTVPLKAAAILLACGTPLLGATWTGKDEVLRALIKLGADLKAHEDRGDNVEGYWSASLSACYRGRYSCLQVLLDASPENPEKLIRMIKFGMESHKKSGNPADYQRCFDLVTEKFPNVTSTLSDTQPAP